MHAEGNGGRLACVVGQSGRLSYRAFHLRPDFGLVRHTTSLNRPSHLRYEARMHVHVLAEGSVQLQMPPHSD
jgi:hypothetical protein